MFGFFSKRKPGPEVSPGGSVINRYPLASWSPGETGAPPTSAAEFAETRHAAYEKLFGKVDAVYAEDSLLIPRVDLRSYYRKAAGGGMTCALVTSGMSDLPMKVPNDPRASRRVELVLYCAEPRHEYIETMRWLAHFPHDQKTWIGFGHTIPNGNPPAPFWGSPALDTVLLMPTVVQRDRTLPQELVLEGDPVDLLWVVPISPAECKLKLKKGVTAIYQLFDQNKHPHVFEPNRKSYV
jgi:Suppressor of fused protein (SUFU)